MQTNYRYRLECPQDDAVMLNPASSMSFPCNSENSYRNTRPQQHHEFEESIPELLSATNSEMEGTRGLADVPWKFFKSA